MSTETQKVDVLAVMNKHIEAERTLGYEASACEGEAARAAVAELIEASREMMASFRTVLRARCGYDDASLDEVTSRVKTALIGVGGIV